MACKSSLMIKFHLPPKLLTRSSFCKITDRILNIIWYKMMEIFEKSLFIPSYLENPRWLSHQFEIFWQSDWRMKIYHSISCRTKRRRGSWISKRKLNFIFGTRTFYHLNRAFRCSWKVIFDIFCTLMFGANCLLTN